MMPECEKVGEPFCKAAANERIESHVERIKSAAVWFRDAHQISSLASDRNTQKHTHTHHHQQQQQQQLTTTFMPVIYKETL